MHIRLLVDSDWGNYEKFIETLSGPQFYVSRRYLEFMEQYLSCELRVYLCCEDLRILGILPTMEVNGPFGKVLNSLPYYGSIGGVSAATVEAESMLKEFYNELASSEEYASATLIENPLVIKHSDEAILHDHVDHRIGQMSMIEGADTVEAILALIESSARRNYRKAIKAGIEVVEDSDDIESLYQMHVQNMSAIGGHAKDAEFFRLISEFFTSGADYKVYYGCLNGAKIAGLLMFIHNDYVEYFTPVSDTNYRDLQPMAAILGVAMADSAKDGARVWNWGGTWESQEGVYRFKRKWGAEQHDYYYYNKVNNKEIYTSSSMGLLNGYPNFFVLPFSQLDSGAA